MIKTINLNAELREWYSMRLKDVLGEDPENIYKLYFDIREANADFFSFLYDYQVVRAWPHVARNTADILGLSEMHVHRLTKKRSRKH